MSQEVEKFIQGLKVTELRDELRKRNLSYVGLKAVLAQRLQEAMMNEQGGETVGEHPINTITENNDNIQKSNEEIQPVPDEEQPSDMLEQENDEPPSDEAPPTTNEGEDEPIAVSVQAEDVPADIVQSEQEEQPQQQEQQQPQQEFEEMDFTVVDSAEASSQDDIPDNMETPEEAPPAANSTETGESQEEVKEMNEEEDDDQNTSTESGGRGIKRNRDEDDNEQSKDASEDTKEDKHKIDPRDVPDPEMTPEWSDEAVLALCDNLFVLPEENSTVTLNPYQSDLHFVIGSDGISGTPLTEGGFMHLKASAKATWGVKNGSYFYECKIEEYLPVGDREGKHLVRLGWSTVDSGSTVGDDRYSFCYESTGQKVTRSNSEDYGDGYAEGDVIGCFVKLSNESKTIFYTKNGVNLYDAFDISDQNIDKALFPHVTSQNVRLSFNFGSNETPYFPPEEGYIPIQEATEEDRECVSTTALSKSDCEVILMVGLPSSGKTYWSSRHISRNSDRSYKVIGPYQILDEMADIKKSITEWKDLVNLTSPMINTLLVLASKLPHNYIIDQVNVYEDTQKRLMSYFNGFQRKAMVVIPPHHELRKRRVDRIREGGCVELPQDVMDAMKANFHIPKQADELFDEIMFSEIYGPASEKIVRQYKDDALGLPTPYIPAKRSRYEPRGRSYGGPRSKGGSYGYGPYGGRHYAPPPPRGGGYYPNPRGYYPPPPPHYRSGYYPPPPSGSWGPPRGRYGPPPPRYGGPRPYYPPAPSRDGGGGYYNRY